MQPGNLVLSFVFCESYDVGKNQDINQIRKYTIERAFFDQHWTDSFADHCDHNGGLLAHAHMDAENKEQKE